MSPRIGLTLPKIVETAAEIADANGIQEVTLASLAQRLGIRSPSLYNHVKGLQDVRKNLGIYGIKQLHNKLEEAAEDKRMDEAIHALGEAYVAFVRKRPGLYEATFLRDEEVRKAGDGIVKLCLQVLQQYGLEGENALHATRGFRSICHGFSSIEQQGGFGLPLDLDTSLHVLLETFIKGLHGMRE